MRVEYLEIVTPDVASTCDTLESVHGVHFSEPVPALGGARTTGLDGGGRVGVRPPMHESEVPVTRPYFRVADAEAAVAAASAAGAEIAHPAMESPGVGTFAIYFQGPAQLGVLQP